ncbi:MAG: DNA-3-methyladenine glycosylase [Caldiserica bacterium]|nr:DNA-3-methyladenine glycosylase [Caldisericota bacterium]MDH7562633.1 DNA-3-methyladenine glycosylase [Caldisericota bacterium]
MSPRNPLPRSFYLQDTLKVARDLIGKLLVRREGNDFLSGFIVETEAYLGPEDKASHASKGFTRRTAPMFGPPGHAYIYLIYGMYYCFNVVTEREGFPAAVLIRALEPCEGIDLMQKKRGVKSPKEIANGPGKLTRALGINGMLNGCDLTSGEVWIEEGRIPGRICQGPRIGVHYAGEWKDKPWRFYESGSEFLSR